MRTERRRRRAILPSAKRLGPGAGAGRGKPEQGRRWAEGTAGRGSAPPGGRRSGLRAAPAQGQRSGPARTRLGLMRTEERAWGAGCLAGCWRSSRPSACAAPSSSRPARTSGSHDPHALPHACACAAQQANVRSMRLGATRAHPCSERLPAPPPPRVRMHVRSMRLSATRAHPHRNACAQARTPARPHTRTLGSGGVPACCLWSARVELDG